MLRDSGQRKGAYSGLQECSTVQDTYLRKLYFFILSSVTSTTSLLRMGSENV